MKLMISFHLENQQNDNVPKGIKVRHGMKTIEFYNEFHGS
jgi:hypothetical protein